MQAYLQLLKVKYLYKLSSNVINGTEVYSFFNFWDQWHLSMIALKSFLASVGKSMGSCKLVSASVMEADNMFQGFSYVPPAEDAFS